MPLARLLRLTGRDRGPALQAEELARRAEPALAARRRGDQRRRLRRRLVRRHRRRPAVFSSIEPAWNDRNLRELAGPHQLAAGARPHPRVHRLPGAADQLPPVPARPLAVDAQRAASATSTRVKRDLVLEVDPELYPEIEGTTDSEISSTSRSPTGSRTTRPAAVARAVGLVEAVGRRHGVEFPMQMTVATTDGERMWAFRYSSEGQSRSLFHSTDVATLREQQYPDNPILHQLSDDARLVVSEPLGDLGAPGTRCPSPAASWSTAGARSCGPSPRLRRSVHRRAGTAILDQIGDDQGRREEDQAEDQEADEAVALAGRNPGRPER